MLQPDVQQTDINTCLCKQATEQTAHGPGSNTCNFQSIPEQYKIKVNPDVGSFIKKLSDSKAAREFLECIHIGRLTTCYSPAPVMAGKNIGQLKT